MAVKTLIIMSKKDKTSPRNTRPETEYDIARKTHRAHTPRHFIDIELHPDQATEDFLRAYASSNAYIARRIRAAMRKGLEQLERNKTYQQLLKEYGATKTHLKTLTPHSDLARQETEHLDNIKDQLNYWQEYYGVTHAHCVEIAAHYSKETGVHSHIAHSTCEDVWKGVETILFGNGKKLHSSHSEYEYPIIKGREINRGIILKIDKETNELYIIMRDAHERARNKGRTKRVIRFKPPEDDLWLMSEYQRVVAFLLDAHAEEKHVRWFMETGEVTSTWRPCFVQIKIIKIRGKWRYHLQICVEAEPLPKYKEDGSHRYDWSKTGRVGLDLGTSTYAASAENGHYVEQRNLGERNNHSTLEQEKEQRRVQRAMDRSRRASNPSYYNANGTIRRGRKHWVRSKRYLRLASVYHELCRKNAANRRYANNETANRLRAHGDVLVTENVNVTAWTKKAKQVVVSSDENGTQRCKYRKRYGKSVQNRCPGSFLAACKRKFGAWHYVDLMFRASQYDHMTGEYVKKPLGQRTHCFPDGRGSPRDLYSAFLLEHANACYDSPDRGACVADFDAFYEASVRMIEGMRVSGIRVLNSGF